jgi:integrase
MKLFTDLSVNRYKKTGKRYHVTEGGGLYLIVNAAGTKSWSSYYRAPDGKRRWHPIGDLHNIYLTKSREMNRDIQTMSIIGIDPKNTGEGLGIEPTLQQVYELFMKKSVDRKGNLLRPSTIIGYTQAFDADILPFLGQRRVRELRKRDILPVLERIIDRGSANQANQVFRRLRRVLAFVAARDIIEASPMSSMEPVGVTKSRSRILSDEEIKTFMEWKPKSEEAWRILRLVLITGARPGEIAGLCKAEIEGDWLEIPPERSKTNTLNRIFLTNMAKKLLPEDRFTISRHAVNRSLRRSIVTGKPYLEDRDKEVVPKVGGQIYPLPLQSFVPHDLRRTMASQLAELGFSDEIIDATQGRVKRGIIGTYNRYRYDKECQLAAEAWTRKLQGIITGKKINNVIPIAR